MCMFFLDLFKSIEFLWAGCILFLKTWERFRILVVGIITIIITIIFISHLIGCNWVCYLYYHTDSIRNNPGRNTPFPGETLRLKSCWVCCRIDEQVAESESVPGTPGSQHPHFLTSGAAFSVPISIHALRKLCLWSAYLCFSQWTSSWKQ